MADLVVQIFTFTATESAAVDTLIKIVAQRSTATALSDRALRLARSVGGGNALLRHTPLSAQGNVIAGTALARAFNETDADYYIFFGCCGAVKRSDVGRIFRAATVSYLSLGSVELLPRRAEIQAKDDAAEVVKLKNKWIVHTDPAEQPPLPTIALPAGAPGQPGTVDGLDITDAHVLATDKVIKVTPARRVPKPIRRGGNVYPKGEWTYAQSLAQAAKSVSGQPVLIDMESFGIASTALAFGRNERVLVLRVATDALSNKTGQTDQHQQDLLHDQLPALDAVLRRIVDPGE